MRRAVALRADRAQSSDTLESPDAPPLFDSVFLAKLEQLYLLSKRLFRGEHRANRPSRQIGSSLEFADYRNYSLGDDLRAIDWNVYARLDRLFIKLFEQEQDLNVWVLIDASASMRWTPAGASRTRPLSRPLGSDEAYTHGTKFDHARRLGASLAYVALANLDRVNLYWFGESLGREMGFVRGKAQFHRVLDFLRRPSELTDASRLQASLQTFVQRNRRRGLVFLVSDLFDPRGFEEALGLLRYEQFDTHVIQVLDPKEVAPEDSGDLRLTESETGSSLEITLDSHLLRRYRQEIQRFLRSVEVFCEKRGMGYAFASTAVPFEDLVLRVLRNGTILK